jgi:hypothetical protein
MSQYQGSGKQADGQLSRKKCAMIQRPRYLRVLLQTPLHNCEEVAGIKYDCLILIPDRFFAPDCLASIRSRGKTGGTSPGISLQLQSRSSRRRSRKKKLNPRGKKVANPSLDLLAELEDQVVKPNAIDETEIDLRRQVTLATSAFWGYHISISLSSRILCLSVPSLFLLYLFLFQYLSFQGHYLISILSLLLLFKTSLFLSFSLSLRDNSLWFSLRLYFVLPLHLALN